MPGLLNLIIALPAIVLALLCCGLGWWLLRSRRREAALKRQLEVQENRLREMMEAQEEERKRFSGALHEEIGMRLHSLKLSASRMAERLALQSPEQGAELRRIAGGLDVAARDIRALSDKLLPRVLAEQGLDAALSELTDQVFRNTTIQARYRASEARGRYGQQVEIATYRMARELLSNAARHAGARNVEIQLDRNGTHLALMVRDDGRGFDPHRTRRRHSGLDLMQSHLQTIGGKSSFISAPGQGTTVTLHVPIS